MLEAPGLISAKVWVVFNTQQFLPQYQEDLSSFNAVYYAASHFLTIFDCQ